MLPPSEQRATGKPISPTYIDAATPALQTAVPAELPLEPGSCHDLPLSVVRELQKTYFESGATRSFAFRITQLMKLRQAIKAYESRILAALNQDLGRSARESFVVELSFLYEEMRHTRRHLKQWMKAEKVATPLTLAPARSRVIREPKGQVLIISPWNYPFQLLMTPLIGAIAAGNTVALKPSEMSPATSKVISELVKEYFEACHITVFEGAVDVATALLDRPWDHIFFTGSPAIGKVVAQAAARFLTPVTLELGGKSPAIVDESANIAVAARRIIFGKFLNAGQTCIAPDYVLVHEDRRDALVAAMKQQIHVFYGDNPQHSTAFCRIINHKHFDRLTRLLTAGHIACGGRSDRSELYIEPTLVVDVTAKDAVMQEEIFGPILPIITFKDYADILSQVRSLPRPLALYLFSERKEMQRSILADISFGGGAVNDTVVHFINPELPFGGIGNSGLGAAHGLNSFLTFSHRKSVLINTTWMDLPLRYAPFTAAKDRLFRFLLDRE
jgi:aldehyde dehydrogenase (NAD+)